MFLVLIVALKFLMAEGRVFCQDLHATAWKPLGFSCPLTCRTILSAVDRLKQIDYQNLVNLQTVKALKMPKYTTKQKRRQTRNRALYKRVHDTAEGKYAQTYKAFIKIIQTEQFFADFKIELKNLTAVLNITCYIAANRTRLLREVLNDCSMNQTKGYILKSFKEFLNKYADPEYPFDMGMTLIVLKHLLSNSNFRYGMMEAILVYLKRALKPEERGITLGKEETIHLTSKHCLSMFVSGCYCHRGYVEQQGICMKPENCSQDPIFVAYLHRVEIN